MHICINNEIFHCAILRAVKQLTIKFNNSKRTISKKCCVDYDCELIIILQNLAGICRQPATKNVAFIVSLKTESVSHRTPAPAGTRHGNSPVIVYPLCVVEHVRESPKAN